MAFGASDSDETLGVFSREDLRLVVLSSIDTYRAYGGLHNNVQTDALPLDEKSPVRPDRYPYRDQIPGMDDYEKLDVEERWIARGATVLRLPMTFGPRDGQRREEFVLRRLRAGRRRIPIGAANGLLTHGYVGDVASGVRLAFEADPKLVAGEIFNLGEERTPPVGLRARWIIEAAGMADDVELVHVPDDALPADLAITGALAQHLLVQSAKARKVLGWTTIDPREALRASVEWHLNNPPESDGDFREDDEALEHAVAGKLSP
jgi:nucleoside-diphosphate-sugar epimerase